MSYTGPNETNYFAEIHPGDELFDSMKRQKEKLFSIPGSQYVSDDPHFTIIAARTADMNSLIDGLRWIFHWFSPFVYKIIGMEETMYPSGLVEARTVVHPGDIYKFKYVHFAAVETSRHHKSRTVMDRYIPSTMNEKQRENLEYCGFPNARDLFVPHASLGRFKPETLNEVRTLLEGYNPSGSYQAYKTIIWRLPTVKEDPNERPEKLEEFLFGI
ncbi:MAG: hypothetical protein HYW24_03885 [Candidatus Aenigmarchaeota archaeon]|nr:hypothetical protein [Candidatus Aenigmarchaeota archaeon]